MSKAFTLLEKYGFQNDGQDRFAKGNVSGYCYFVQWSFYVNENGVKTRHVGRYDDDGLKNLEKILKNAA